MSDSRYTEPFLMQTIDLIEWLRVELSQKVVDMEQADRIRGWLSERAKSVAFVSKEL